MSLSTEHMITTIRGNILATIARGAGVPLEEAERFLSELDFTIRHGGYCGEPDSWCSYFGSALWGLETEGTDLDIAICPILPSIYSDTPHINVRGHFQHFFSKVHLGGRRFIKQVPEALVDKEKKYTFDAVIYEVETLVLEGDDSPFKIDLVYTKSQSLLERTDFYEHTLKLDVKPKGVYEISCHDEEVFANIQRRHLRINPECLASIARIHARDADLRRACLAKLLDRYRKYRDRGFTFSEEEYETRLLPPA
jgi:hypothetical protein